MDSSPCKYAGWLLLALFVVAGCTVRVQPEPVPTSTAKVAATTTALSVATSGTTRARRVFTLERQWSGARVRPAPVGAAPLAMRTSEGEYPDEAVNLVLVFPLLKAPADCVREVELWLRVLRFEHRFRYQEPQIGAYPSKLLSLASARPTSRSGFETLIDNRPTGFGVRTPDEAWMHFEITQLYRTWAEGGPFPSALATVPVGTPLVVDVRATDFGQPLFEARIAGLGDPGTAPHLRWSARPDCRPGMVVPVPSAPP